MSMSRAWSSNARFIQYGYAMADETRRKHGAATTCARCCCRPLPPHRSAYSAQIAASAPPLIGSGTLSWRPVANEEPPAPPGSPGGRSASSGPRSVFRTSASTGLGFALPADPEPPVPSPPPPLELDAPILPPSSSKVSAAAVAAAECVVGRSRVSTLSALLALSGLSFAAAESLAAAELSAASSASSVSSASARTRSSSRSLALTSGSRCISASPRATARSARCNCPASPAYSSWYGHERASTALAQSAAARSAAGAGASCAPRAEAYRSPTAAAAAARICAKTVGGGWFSK
mmetsp:Transcript_24362/g.60596  ORF Transcript_24362/g.60596 Transcript_24362/m.60596 type:complete len:293 (-) Transcript_24362:434-1312(-)